MIILILVIYRTLHFVKMTIQSISFIQTTFGLTLSPWVFRLAVNLFIIILQLINICTVSFFQSNQESDFVPISPPKSFYDEKVDIVESRRTSPTKLSSVFSLDPPSISNHTKMTTSLPSFQSVSKSSTSSSLSEDFNQNSHNRDGDRSVYEAAVALNDVTLSDLADSVHNDHCV